MKYQMKNVFTPYKHLILVRKLNFLENFSHIYSEILAKFYPFEKINSII